MALRSGSDIERPDHTRSISGSTGDVMDQEPGTGKGVYRKGAATEEADVDVGSVNEPLDLTAGNFASGQKDTGGAEALAGHIIDDNGNLFNVEIDWMDEDGNVLVTDSRDTLNGVSDVQFNLVIRSDHFEVRIEDNNGATAVHGSVNAH